MQPFFTIVLPSTLKHYATAAKDRQKKLHRAVQSVIEQSFTDWELLVISDGCDQTYEEMTKYEFHPQVDCIMIKKHPLWSGAPRNTGINQAKGKFITYLDNDDYFGMDHLKIIHENINPEEKKLYWYNDLIWSGSAFIERKCDIHTKFQHGTSNFTHVNEPERKVYWPLDGYEHDYHFGRELLKRYEPVLIPTPQYHVCHIHTKYDV